MNELVQFFKDFGNIINTALLVSLIGVAFAAIRMIIEQKDAQIALLRERAETFSIEKVTERFRALKEHYEEQVQDWLDASMKALEEEKRKAIEAKEKEFQKRIEEEIEKRNTVVQDYVKREIHAPEMIKKLSHSQVCGTYSVIGHNPYSPESTYFGELAISEQDETLVAEWVIGSTKQRHAGVGILAGNSTMAFAFEYFHPLVKIDADTQVGVPLYGVVLYEFLSDQVIRGYWTSFVTSKLGFEEGRKIKTS